MERAALMHKTIELNTKLKQKQWFGSAPLGLTGPFTPDELMELKPVMMK